MSTFPFHSADRRRDAGPPHADGPAEGLVGERDFMAVQAVLSDEKPAGQPLLETMAHVADDELRALNHDGLNVGEQEIAQVGAARPRRA